MRRFPLTLVLLSAGVLIHSATAATIYETAVRSLQPTYYYQLNEPNATGGVIDSMGRAAPGSYNGDYVNGTPEAGCPGPLYINGGQDGSGAFEYYETAIPGVGGAANLAHCSNNEGHVILGPAENYGANAITVALFFRADFAQGGDRLFTNNLTDPETSFQVNVANDGLVVAVNPALTGELAERSLLTPEGVADRALIRAEYGWFHVVASTSGSADERAGNIQVWVNGVNRTENLEITNWGWGVNTNSAKIGGRHEDPLATTTHSGAQDEVSIWLDRVLTEAEVQTLWKAALGQPVVTMNGDYNGDGAVNVADIDLQATAMAQFNPDLAKFDENKDGLVNYTDRQIWVRDHAHTWIGDANFDREFNSTDFVVIFTAGLYETGNPAGWGQGDWEGDMRFDSSDFVAAFSDGGYELGPRPAIASVPEPGVTCLVGMALLACVFRRRS